MSNKKPIYIYIYISAWKNDMKVLNWPQSNTHILNTLKSKTSNNKSLRLMRVTSSSIFRNSTGRHEDIKDGGKESKSTITKQK
jgi:hypothetical protein